MIKYKPIFDYILESLTFYNDNTEVNRTVGVDYLLTKAIEDCYAIQVLLAHSHNTMEQGRESLFLKQGFTIARSLIESTILFVYLLFFEEKRVLYLESSQLWLFKNEFIRIKNARTNPFYNPEILGFNLQDLDDSVISAFNKKMTGNNQKLILNIIKKDVFEITDDSIKKLDKFFKNYKPFFVKIREMYDEIGKINISGLDIKNMTNDEYNLYSQITHNIFPLQKLELRSLVRICSGMCNLMIASMRVKYNVQLPNNLLNTGYTCYYILHPEDAGHFPKIK
jgi:hypothetical protein